MLVVREGFLEGRLEGQVGLIADRVIVISWLPRNYPGLGDEKQTFPVVPGAGKSKVEASTDGLPSFPN